MVLLLLFAITIFSYLVFRIWSRNIYQFTSVILLSIFSLSLINIISEGNFGYSLQRTFRSEGAQTALKTNYNITDIIGLRLCLKSVSEFPITDLKMTRFMIDLDQAVKQVWSTFSDMVGGEIYVPKKIINFVIQ